MSCSACQGKVNSPSSKDLEDLFVLPASDHKPSEIPDNLKKIAEHFKDLPLVESGAIEPTPVVGNGPPPTPPVHPQNLSMPNLKEMAFGLTQNIKTALTDMAMKGTALAPRGVVDKRMDLCLACEFFVHSKSRCSKCGCFMNIKTRLLSASCPVSKW